ncbi:MAG: DUF86 domain-containing protein [Ruminococcus sp.]|jgi:uncharacterized protein with HEPN domain|nr:DUF86 domain-containing protein [Ruminococcus sp.]
MLDNINKQVLEKILFHCQLISGYVKKHDYSYEEFLSDYEFFDAVSMREMQIGEVSKNLSDDFRNETLDKIPWNQIKGMRNLYAHHYDDMDISDIWDTAINDIPILQKFCEETLKSDGDTPIV